ncbi:hypothetical protein [Parasphingorhabdus sp.]|uniref:hypothetical protein n=1 Tax=Parasphingorhabdus sp. TaxID=2709688 RepID=UPI002F9480CA
MSTAPKIENAALAMDAWKKVVQTQEHFNEICMKVRTLYATVLAAILSLYGVFLKDSKDHELEILGFYFDPLLFVTLAVFVTTTLFYFVDKDWYHRLLMGAVAQGTVIEERWGNILPEITLGSKISQHSPVDISDKLALVGFLKLFVNDERFKKTGKLHSVAKIQVFYKPIQCLSFWFFVILCIFGGIQYEGRSLAGCLYQWSTSQQLSISANRGA